MRPVGERALIVDAGSQERAHRLRDLIVDAAFPGVEEVVVGATTVLVEVTGQLGATATGLAELAAALEHGVAAEGRVGPVVEIPVTYDGPDLAEVADLTGLSVEEVVARHRAGSYTVGFVGFTPGFAYLTGLDPLLHVPRRATPRVRVPARSVAMAGAYTGVYPQATPGGWQLLGSTPLAVFDALRDPPTELVPGRRVRFVEARSRRGGSGTGGGAEARGAAEAGGGAEAGSGSRDEADGGVPSGGAALVVVKPGALTTVQDHGRSGWAHLGVPRAGAVDGPSLATANQLLGNPPGTAGLEVTLIGPDLRFEGGLAFAIAGGEVAATLDGLPVPMGEPVAATDGQLLSVGPVRRGLRSYLALAGGLDVRSTLGSRATDTLAGLGPPPLRAGDRLPIGSVPCPGGPPGSGSVHTERPGGGWPAPLGGWPAPLGRSPAPVGGPPAPVTVVLGPRDDWFTEEAVATFLGAPWTVTPKTDRTGARLSGPALARRPERRDRELPSEGLVAGAIQVPPDGQPVVLLANHPATGGYPVVAVVVERDLPVVGQARPGAQLSFRSDG